MVGGGGGSEHNDISEELKRQAGGKNGVLVVGWLDID